MNKIKFGISQFYKVTPKEILKIADALKAVCISLGGCSVIAENKYFIVASAFIYTLCDVIPRLFGES